LPRCPFYPLNLSPRLLGPGVPRLWPPKPLVLLWACSCPMNGFRVFLALYPKFPCSLSCPLPLSPPGPPFPSSSVVDFRDCHYLFLPFSSIFSGWCFISPLLFVCEFMPSPGSPSDLFGPKSRIFHFHSPLPLVWFCLPKPLHIFDVA